MGLGETRLGLDLTGTTRPNVEGFPTHASLDAVSPDNPVILTHASGHGVFVNARALALSGITRATRNPPGGEILKDTGADGRGIGDAAPRRAAAGRSPALRIFTMGNAFAAFEESIKGSLTVGKLADVTVLSKDITTVPDDDIRSARVVYTIVGGQIVYVAAGL